MAYIISIAIINILIYIALYRNYTFLNKNLKSLVAVATGIILSILFLHLLPEFYSSSQFYGVPLFFFLFYIIIDWVTHTHDHDHVEHDEHKHTLKYAPLIGLITHTIVDGAIIYLAFASNFTLGLLTTLAIAMHHVPMMIGVALRYNNNRTIRKYIIISSLFMFVGAIISAAIDVEMYEKYLLGISVASFMYLGAHDLIGYLNGHREGKTFNRIVLILIGIIIGFIASSISH